MTNLWKIQLLFYEKQNDLPTLFLECIALVVPRIFSVRCRNNPGVIEAQVNYGNEQAVVTTSGGVESTAIVQAVKKLVTARMLQWSGRRRARIAAGARITIIEKQVIVGVVLTVGLMLSMVSGLPAIFSNPLWLWLLATPIQFWLGRRFYQSTWSGLKIVLHPWIRWLLWVPAHIFILFYNLV